MCLLSGGAVPLWLATALAGSTAGLVAVRIGTWSMDDTCHCIWTFWHPFGPFVAWLSFGLLVSVWTICNMIQF
ncbi:hypothetical protein C8R46DRAFT_1087594 [Mycena filopes]|nr:hypothetical protein C8R46DRAFT_1087594 [Mycena filopes]